MSASERTQKRIDERNEARRVATDVVGLAIKLAATLPAHSRKFFWRELAGRTVRALRSPDRQNEETELPTKEPNQ